MRQLIFADAFVVGRGQLAWFELLGRTAGLDDLRAAASAGDQVDDHAAVFCDDDELRRGPAVVRVQDIDAKLVLAAVLARGADNLQRLLLRDRVPG